MEESGKDFMGSIKDHVYEELRRRIICCEIAPGSIIDERALVEEFNVSRTPVREALSVLAQEELVIIYPRRAIMATPITIQDVDNVFEVRELLEPYIVRTFAGRLDRHELLRLAKSITKADDPITMAKKDDEFHNYLISSCTNPVLASMLRSVCAQTQRMRIAMGCQEQRADETIAEHLAIAHSILDSDGTQAEIAMRQHLNHARLTVLGYYSREAV